MAAECAYLAIDERVKAEFDYDTGHHRYTGVIDKVKKTFDDDIKKAEIYFNQLQEVINKFESRPWSVASRARQGSLYDSCRTGLFNARPPGLRLYTDKEEALAGRDLRREDLQEQADAIRQRREDCARARALAQRRRQGDGRSAPRPCVGPRVEGRNSAVDTAIRACVLHQHPRRPEDPRVQPGVIDPGRPRRPVPGRPPPDAPIWRLPEVRHVPAPLPVVP
jgi:hypothetical protein